MTANLSRSFSIIIICNLKSIRCTKLKKMAKNLIFGYLDHSKWHFLWILNDPAWAIPWPTHAHHLVLSKYAISSRSDVRNARNWPKPIWIIQKGRNAQTRRTENFLKKEPDSSRTCGFRGDTPKNLQFHKKIFPEKSCPRFSVKFSSKSKKGRFWHVFVIIE